MKEMFNGQVFFHQLRRYNEILDRSNTQRSKYSSYHARRGFDRFDELQPPSSIISYAMIDDLTSNLFEDHLSLVGDQWTKCQERLMKKIGNIQNDFQRQSEISLKKQRRQCQTKLFQWMGKTRSRREHCK